MPVFTLKCPKCGLEEDYIFSVYEELETNTQCSSCNKKINRKQHRVFNPEDAPVVKGETVVRKQTKGRTKG